MNIVIMENSYTDQMYELSMRLYTKAKNSCNTVFIQISHIITWNMYEMSA